MTVTQQELPPAFDQRPGVGPTLVLLHYRGGSARTWDLVVDRLTGRATVAVDFRGWGRSAALPGPYTLRRYAEDVRAVLDAAGVDDYVLVGHSMGGKVAQLVAATRPAGLRALVLVASGPARPGADITPDHRTALAHAYDTEPSVMGARDEVLTATTLPERVAAQVVADSRSSAVGARTEWPLHGIAEDITEDTRRIDVPVLVVAGEHDVVEPVETLRENLLPYLAGAELVVLPRTGHLIPLEAAAELADVITAFAPAA